MIRLVTADGITVQEWPETPRGMQSALSRLALVRDTHDTLRVADATIPAREAVPHPSRTLAAAVLRVCLS